MIKIFISGPEAAAKPLFTGKTAISLQASNIHLNRSEVELYTGTAEPEETIMEMLNGRQSWISPASLMDVTCFRTLVTKGVAVSKADAMLLHDEREFTNTLTFLIEPPDKLWYQQNKAFVLLGKRRWYYTRIAETLHQRVGMTDDEIVKAAWAYDNNVYALALEVYKETNIDHVVIPCAANFMSWMNVATMKILNYMKAMNIEDAAHSLEAPVVTIEERLENISDPEKLRQERGAEELTDADFFVQDRPPQSFAMPVHSVADNSSASDRVRQKIMGMQPQQKVLTGNDIAAMFNSTEDPSDVFPEVKSEGTVISKSGDPYGAYD